MPEVERGVWRRAAALAVAVHLVSATVAYGGLAWNERPGDVPHYAEFGTGVMDGVLPYADVYMEYPPGALPVFVLPATVDENHYQFLFKLVMALCGAATIVICARSLAALGADRRRYAMLAPMALAPLLLGHVFLNRYDPWPALLIAATILLLLLQREAAAFGALGVAVAAKLFPAAAFPIASVRAWRVRGGAGMLRGWAAFAAVSLVIWGPFAVIAPGGLGYSLETQIERHLQIESLGASTLLGLDVLGVYETSWRIAPPGSIDLIGALPDAVGVLSFLLQLAAVVLVVVLYARGPESDERLVTAFSAAVVVTVLGKVLSPQYLTMLLPVVPLVAGRAGRLATGLLVLALLGTQLLSTGRYLGLRAAEPDDVVLLLGRNALLVAMMVVLLVDLARATAERQAPASATRPEVAVGRAL